MSQRRFSFIIFLLSSFFFLFLFFAISPNTVYAGHACPTTNTYCDGTSTCNDLCDPYGHACGTVCDSCGVVCSTPPPLGQCSTDSDCPWPTQNADYCCGSSVCNNKTTYRCGIDSVCTSNTFEVSHTVPCPNGCSNGACNPAPPPPQVCSPSSQGSVCNTGTCSDGSVCAQGHVYCLWDGSGWGSCSEEVNNCASQCAIPPPPPSCGDGTCNIGEDCNCADCDPCAPPPPPPNPTPPPGSCYSSPSNPFQDTYTTGSSTVTIRHLGWDNSDGSIGGYANASNGSTYRTVNMNDSNLECKGGEINLQFTNNWGVSSGRNFSLTNTINSKSAGNTLGAGWQLNSANSTIGDCSTTQVGPSQRTTNSGSDTYAATLYYCGDSQCACGETNASCPGDCPPPIPAAPTGLSASCPAPGTTGSLSWNSVAGATYYDVWYDASFKYNIIGTSTTIAGFNPGSGHTWGVRACNSSGCSGWSSTSSFTCVPASPTTNAPACPTPGNSATLSWNSSSGATYYNVSYDALSQNNIALTSTTISGLTPGSSHTWGVKACNGAGCSALTNGTGFTCALPPCPGGLGACGGIPQAGLPDPRTIGVCNGTWAYNPGPSLAYNIWCAANANPTRGYCYQCNSNITPWIQTTGDVHSNEGINAPGGP